MTEEPQKLSLTEGLNKTYCSDVVPSYLATMQIGRWMSTLNHKERVVCIKILID